MEVNPAYMRRALQLAALGRTMVSPNPMVGAVIADRDGRIIGEGWHRKWGEGHAEVNAIASVGDKSLLKDSTLYVTLEPCSHYGKTPPCANLIIDSRIPRVVVGCSDPFAKVAGRGIAMLRDAGIEVTVPFMERECRELNRRFITAHTLGRPYVMLKYAMSADGYIDTAVEEPVRWSSPATSLLMHSLRATFDAIMVGSGTVINDDPRLTVRIGRDCKQLRQPRRVVVDRRRRIKKGDRYNVFRGDRPALLYHAGSLQDVLTNLYGRGITSLLVEGGATLLRAFMAEGLWDEARVEVVGQTAVDYCNIPKRYLVERFHVGLPSCGILRSDVEADGRRILTFFAQNTDL